jgi:hypothetical protein
VNTVYINPIIPSRIGRIARSIFRHAPRSREFPARNERLITAAELVRYGV